MRNVLCVTYVTHDSPLFLNLCIGMKGAKFETQVSVSRCFLTVVRRRKRSKMLNNCDKLIAVPKKEKPNLKLNKFN